MRITTMFCLDFRSIPNHVAIKIALELKKLLIDNSLLDVKMASAGLSGTLLSGIGNLSHLRTLLLQNNQLSGPIAAEIGKLSELQTLDLSSNQFVGGIPSSLDLLSQLSYLWLSKNNLSGQIPPLVTNLTGVKKFSLNIKKTGKGVLPKNEKDQLEKGMVRIKEDLSLRHILDEIETGGPTAIMRLFVQFVTLSSR
ncbi:putative LRR receptor-like serine/threonine-protein kinase [Arachis hypogaea]|nr:putative LRR receptor-like serine/threonine-protein kinase [Arachis hypogaea]